MGSPDLRNPGTGGSTRSRIVIVGGGITGAFAAYFASRLGSEVTLVERDEIGAHASGNNPGGLNPLHGPGIPGPMGELALESLRLHLEHWAELRRLSGINLGGRLVERLHVAVDDAEAGLIRAREALYNSTPGFSARWLGRDELRRIETRLCEHAVGGLWTRGNARVDPGPYTRAVVGAAVRHGARVVRADARDLLHQNGRVTAVRIDSETLECDGVVIAQGAWCNQASGWLGVPLPVEPVKGELLLAETDSGAPVADISWRDFGVYAAGGDRVLLGGTEDRTGLDGATTSSARARILEGIHRLLPRIGSLRVIRQFAGLRPVTPDGMPILGIPVPWENVCVAAGGGRKGMLLGAGLGLAAAELLRSGKTSVPVSACAPDRRRWEP